MAHSTGTIQLGPCSTRPDELLRFRADSLHALPEGFELQAMPVLDDEGDIFLVTQGHETRVALAHLPVTASEPFVPEQANVIPSSLAELLCLPVLSTVHALALLPHRAAFVAEQLEPPHLVHARQLTDDLQLEPHWSSSPYVLIAHSPVREDEEAKPVTSTSETTDVTHRTERHFMFSSKQSRPHRYAESHQLLLAGCNGGCPRRLVTHRETDRAVFRKREAYPVAINLIVDTQPQSQQGHRMHTHPCAKKMK